MQFSKHLSLQGNNILLIGNWSYKNLGDELILLWTIKLLQQQGKTIFIQAYDKKRLKSFFSQFLDVSKITFLREIPKWPRSLLGYIRKWQRRELVVYWKIDSVIVGWGEILTEENPNSYWYRLLSLLPLLIKKLFVKTPIYLMWWIQIPKKNLNKKLFTFLLKRTTHIYARDFETIDELKKYGYSDVEFFMDTAYFAYDRFLSPNPSPSEKGAFKYIVVNINKNGAKFMDEIVRDVQHYLEKWYHVYYVPVSKGNNAEYNDSKYYGILKNTLSFNNQHSKLSILDWEWDFPTFLEVLKGAEIVISTRLHLFLVASFLGLQTKVYPYQKKILKMQKVLAQTNYIK